nr:Spastin like [Ipomoea batatas]
MYVRRIKTDGKTWSLVSQRGKHLISSYYRNCAPTQTASSAPILESCTFQGTLNRRHLLDTFKSTSIGYGRTHIRLLRRSDVCLSCSQLRFYSSEGDGRNASEDKHARTVEQPSSDKAKTWKQKVGEQARHCDGHAELGELEQKEWLCNEKLSIDSKKKESPFLPRRERFKNEFLRRIVPWEKIAVSWDTFPYYVHEHTKSLLVECAASHLKHRKLTMDYGGHLNSSSGRIMLQSIPGTELYRERFVRAVAKDLKVPLLVLDNSILASYDFGEDCSSESESDEDAESAEEYASESEVDDATDAANEEEWASSGEARSEASDDERDVQASAEALKKLVPYNLEDFEKRVSGESDDSSESPSSEAVDSSENTKRPFRKGDRVKYAGPSVIVEADNRIVLGKIATSDGPTNAYTVIRGRTLSSGQRGEVYELGADQVAVILDISDTKMDGQKDEKPMAEDAKPSVYWIPVKHMEHDNDVQAEETYIAMEALCEVLKSVQPLIVYFPDSSLWLSRTVSKPNRKEFLQKVQEMFDQLSGPVVLICGKNKIETGTKEKEKFTMILPNLGRLAKLPLPLKQLTEELSASKRSEDDEIHKLFTNIMYIPPPKDEDTLGTFNKQIEEDRRIVISRSNLTELHKVLEEHDLYCLDLLHVNSDGVILTKQKAEKVVGWAKNHYLSSCVEPSIKGDRLHLPRESLDIAILRLKEQEAMSKKPSHGLKSLAKNEYESNFLSAVVPPGEIGVRFDDVGALEDVKKALNELVILPMRRPELFSHGNLLRPCKGILLFGPPGTGKTLIAKALATEAGANFMSITGSSLTSKWFGDAEKLTKALFSFASKLAPVIIFVDEVDSLLGARGGAFEHEATRRMRNEFMAAWDGLRTKDSQRILILGATNRPFDLDDAVIRRLPRRIYVDLPDAENRLKILNIILAQENLETNFPFEQLANATEGYSGSDLKNLCIAAAYRPVQELLEEEMKGGKPDGHQTLRSLNLDDFLQSKAKVGPSVAYDAASMNELRKWNEQYGEGGSRRKSPFGF